jgi:hypothetical protein
VLRRLPTILATHTAALETLLPYRCLPDHGQWGTRTVSGTRWSDGKMAKAQKLGGWMTRFKRCIEIRNKKDREIVKKLARVKMAN